MLLAPGGEEMLAHAEEELVDSEEALKSSELFWRILQRELSGLWHRDRQPSVSSSLLLLPSDAVSPALQAAVRMI